MNARLEIRTKMAALNKEYAALAAEVKVLDEQEKRETNRAKFKDYVHKILVSGTHIDAEPTVYAVSDEDRDTAREGRIFVVSEQNKDGSCFLMLKTLDDLPRVQLLFTRLQAAEKILDKKEQDIETQVKILLGEKVDTLS
jgi:hypothetical protein